MGNNIVDLDQVLKDITDMLQNAPNHRPRARLASQKSATYQTTVMTNNGDDELILTLILS